MIKYAIVNKIKVLKGSQYCFFHYNFFFRYRKNMIWNDILWKSMGFCCQWAGNFQKKFFFTYNTSPRKREKVKFSIGKLHNISSGKFDPFRNSFPQRDRKNQGSWRNRYPDVKERATINGDFSRGKAVFPHRRKSDTFDFIWRAFFIMDDESINGTFFIYILSADFSSVCSIQFMRIRFSKLNQKIFI